MSGPARSSRAPYVLGKFLGLPTGPGRVAREARWSRPSSTISANIFLPRAWQRFPARGSANYRITSSGNPTLPTSNLLFFHRRLRVCPVARPELKTTDLLPDHDGQKCGFLFELTFGKEGRATRGRIRPSGDPALCAGSDEEVFFSSPRGLGPIDPWSPGTYLRRPQGGQPQAMVA